MTPRACAISGGKMHAILRFVHRKLAICVLGPSKLNDEPILMASRA